MKKYLVLIILIVFLIFPLISLGQCRPWEKECHDECISRDLLCLELDYPEVGGFDLNVDQDLNEMIAWSYYFIVTISGIASFVMLVWGGFEWLTSVGNASKISNARERINSAFLGLIIVLASFLILKAINPELITLRLPTP